MSTEAAIAGALRPQSPGRKRSKAVATKLSGSTHSEAKATAAVGPPTRQYLTRSKAAAIPYLGSQKKSKAPAVDFQSLHSSDDSAPSSTLLSDDLFLFDWKGFPLVLDCSILLTCWSCVSFV